MEHVVLRGSHVRLDPLERRHAGDLVAASAGGGDLYKWSPVPRTIPEAERYIETALAARDAGSAFPFVVVRNADDAPIGFTRFFDIERFAWPPGHPRERAAYDVCEIGYTWYAPSAIRTAANTEAKLLMLTHAFEVWEVLRVCLHTDARNERSRAAIERIGGQFEGILRAHRIASDYTARDSARYSIVAAEWPSLKERLERVALAPRQARGGSTGSP